ncbi:pyridoxal-dependent decarboxylase, exosortase A system-associated [Propionivibrio sp.]|uniref:pyridoxal-dependent decarboxylase, exosortase A system-associated n=1 Tax=Propionivibrio sp. TaxID=2212460 RepID=UPI00261E76C3|nr:pyridoxal-dependent decarboxylase, exosortase A system-associated [Propionivibrio sp.]
METTADLPPADSPLHINHGFPVYDGELRVAGSSLAILAARAGQTPFYAYDRTLILHRIKVLREAFNGAAEIHYALKANPMPAIVDLLAQQVDGFDVASGNELQTALNSGIGPRNISFAGPGKRPGELAQAVAAGILINAESIEELRRLEKIAETLGQPARVAIRINPDFELKYSGMKMGGGPKQFGIDASLVPQALEEIQGCWLSFEGFHIYSGSQNLKAEAIIDSQNNAMELVARMAGTIRSPILSINLGGGFGIPYFPGEKPLALSRVGENLQRLRAHYAQRFPQARWIVELGRYLVGEAGIYVCRVLEKKRSCGHTFLIVDGGMHHHLAASGHFGQVIRKNFPVSIGNRIGSTTTEVVSVVGPLCTPMDTLADKMHLPVAEAGDFVVVFQSGAYGFSASPHSFLSHPPPVEIVV